MLLQVNNLSIGFGSGTRDTVSGIGFSVDSGKITALVGESGCGKSISCLALAGLLPPSARIRSGEVIFSRDGRSYDLLKLPPRQLRKFRGGQVAYIFQEPASSLNPVMRIGSQIAEVLRLHRPEIKDEETEIIRLLAEVGIPAPEERVSAYPHELSGGMQQRVMIAMALAGNPKLLIADEPTTALDVTIQAQILEVIRALTRERGLGVILVTHNLGIVSSLADQVTVMYAGTVAESGSVAEIINHPRHPYTAALLRAVPVLGSPGELTGIPGRVPEVAEFPSGCRFCGRCAVRQGLSPDEAARCENLRPAETGCADVHRVFCHHPLP